MADDQGLFDNSNGNEDGQAQKRKHDEGDDGDQMPRKRKMDDSTKHELRILLQSKNAGAVIGKGGHNIAALRAKYNAGIYVPDCKAYERLLTISCGIGNALKCLDDIIPCLEDYQQFKGQASFDCELRMLVPQAQVGAVIGRHGFKIKQLRDDTKTKIKVYPDCCPKSTDRVICIGGERSRVIQCIGDIVDLVMDPSHRGPHDPYDPRKLETMDDYFSFGDYGGFVPESGRGGGRGGDSYGGGYDGWGGGGGGGRRGGGGGGGGGGGRMGRDGGGRGGRDMGRGGGGGPRGRGGNRGGGGPRGGQSYGMRNDYEMCGSMGNMGGGMGNMGGGMGNMGGGMGNMGGNMGGGMGGNMGGGMGNMGSSMGMDGGMGPGMNQMGGNQMGGSQMGGNQMGGGMGGMSSLMGNMPQQNFTQDTMSGLGNQGMMFGQSGGMGGGNTSNTSGSVQKTQVSIPKNLAGAIIGRGGTRIQMARQRSGASIQIEEAVPGANDRIITIEGGPQEIENAQYLLQKCVRENSGDTGDY